MISRRVIDQLFEENEEQGAIFFNLSKGNAGRLLMGVGFYSKDPDFSGACASYVKELKALNPGQNFEEDPVTAVDNLVSSYNGVVVRKLEGHDRARYEVLSRRKKTGLTDLMVTRVEKVFPSITPDDVVLWRMRVDGPGELVYAGVAFYGESDIVSRSPLFEPKQPKPTVKRLGEPRKLR